MVHDTTPTGRRLATALDSGASLYRHRLDVYVAGHCPGCDASRELCATVNACFADLQVRLVDLDLDPDAKPPGVVAVPAFVLDGAVIFFGNPHVAKLLTRLEAALGTKQRKYRRG